MKKRRKIKIMPILILILLLTAIIIGVWLFVIKGGQRIKAFDLAKYLVASEGKTGTKLLLDNTTKEYIFQSNNYNQPNNYITFNNEEWRIVRINEDKSITIIRSEGDLAAYDEVGKRTTKNSGTYCTSGGNFGCNLFTTNNNFINGNQKGTTTKDASVVSYLNGYYDNLANKDLLIDKPFYYGGVNYTNRTFVKMKEYSYVTNIGLLNLEEYLKASINYGNSCKTGTSDEALECYNYLTTEMLLLTPLENSTVNVYYVTNNGDVSITTAGNQKKVRAVVTLKSEIKATGNGTKNDPYKIEIITP